MPNMLQTGAAWLGEKLKTSAGRAVSILQGAGPAVSVTAASLALVEYEVEDASGFLVLVKHHDWTFEADDLSITLRNGAVITDTATSQTFEVGPVGKKSCSEPLDASGVLLLVHSKRIS